ncbi:uncharacterized protein ACLA_004420 [Aspergillus clavatus NRRL 1]|uniref:Uncharacterized protein n=1 Tax=Aspergillus clavatus (strain ATCC 1007 / CBS 513.65 / DSM 816 / NCTC 3887 / NRRL 1 / QM 1276 / 107) TaxID=344612 RepID=A1C5R0_ASPCL|nr:uncharacterized protein ACLA_004420 [Aspergillus clavatus NRRL 1]EAW15028.1 conserved hypothetical protein [Aspergillus clavatus NRRL 1]
MQTKSNQYVSLNNMPQKVPLQDIISAEGQGHITTYYIYREENDRILITTAAQPKTQKRRQKKQKEDPSSLEDPAGYYVHRPYLSFHHPPRTLHHTASRDGDSICLIHSYSCWRRWRLQFGPAIATAIDPRGVVKWQHRTHVDNKVHGDCDLKGYKVRCWRLWGESGKQYHRDVNAKRNQGHDSEDDQACHEQLQATDTFQMAWSTPFSKQTRKYKFSYSGIEFAWKGTKNLPGDSKWPRRLMPWHHLKLVAQLPCKMAKHELNEVVIAQFTCSAEADEYGSLIVLDSQLCMVLGLDTVPQSMIEERAKGTAFAKIHDVIVATAICMIVGEWQKRKTIVSLVITLLFVGATTDW